jgi:hypothetical protein
MYPVQNVNHQTGCTGRRRDDEHAQPHANGDRRQATSVVCRTGTPLIAGEEERTREVFGDYVSIYDFAQSAADGATAPLYYESRLPELHF